MRFRQKVLALILIFVVLSACAALTPSRRTGMGLWRLSLTPSLDSALQATGTDKAGLPAQLSQTVEPQSADKAEQSQELAPKPSEKDKTLLDEYMPRHEVLAETEHFIFYAQDDYFPVDLKRWKAYTEEIYSYVSDRVEVKSSVKISMGFMPAQKEACPIRGLASSKNPPVVIIFADPGVSEAYLLAVLSHEAGHAIPAQGFKGGLPNDISLSEGLASWASGKYWNAWMGVPTIHHLVRSYIDSGKYLSLSDNVDLPEVYPWQEGTGEGCLARRDQIYSEWASFIDFLIKRYGWDKVHKLFESAHTTKKNGQEVKYPTDYQRVLGQPLDQLETEWKEFVLRETRIKRQAHEPFSP